MILQWNIGFLNYYQLNRQLSSIANAEKMFMFKIKHISSSVKHISSSLVSIEKAVEYIALVTYMYLGCKLDLHLS